MSNSQLPIFEEHAEVLAHWLGRGVRSRTVLCFDAHLDLRQISAERMSRIRSARSPAAVSTLMKPHPQYPDGDTGFGIENFLYAAHAMGLIQHLIWVVPPFIEPGYDEAAVADLLQMDGVDFDQLLSFHRDAKGIVQGTLLGLQVSVCRVEQLAAIELSETPIVDIDIDYFIHPDGDRPWSRPDVLVAALADLGVPPEDVTISRSVSSGFTPLRYRYLADHLVALWTNDQALAAHYARLLHLDAHLDAPRTPEEIESESAAHPGCAATHHLAAQAVSDPESAARHRARAAELEPAYAPDLLRSICEHRARHLPIDASRVAAFEREARNEQDPDRRALAHAAIGLIYCVAGQVERAREHYDRCTEHLPHHPELALEIAKGLIGSASFEQALPYLQAAEHDDETRTAAFFLRGFVLMHTGDVAGAVHWLGIARNRAPAWLEIQSVLSDAQHRAGFRDAGVATARALSEHRDRLAVMERNLA